MRSGADRAECSALLLIKRLIPLRPNRKIAALRDRNASEALVVCGSLCEWQLPLAFSAVSWQERFPFG